MDSPYRPTPLLALCIFQVLTPRRACGTRAGKNLRFLGFLGFNVEYAQSYAFTLYTGHRNTIKKKAYPRRLSNAMLCLTLRNNSNCN